MPGKHLVGNHLQMGQSRASSSNYCGGTASRARRRVRRYGSISSTMTDEELSAAERAQVSRPRGQQLDEIKAGFRAGSCRS